MKANDDDFQIIDSHYQISSSSRSESSAQQKGVSIYQVLIKPTKTEVDLSIVQNQYYQLDVKKKGVNYCSIERRFSQFELIYEILSRKQAGYIFPAFPSNGIFAFMKSKVLISKDLEFINRRTKTIERFFNKVMNDPLFDPDNCKEFKEFLSPGREFQARKQIQKNNKPIFSIPWNKLKNYFSSSKQNKYFQKQQKLQKIKVTLQALYSKCRALIDCLKEEFCENQRFLIISFSNELHNYKHMLLKHDLQQKENLKKLQDLEFQIFCENEDLHMAEKIFEKINELKDNEDNYIELKTIEERLQSKLDAFIGQKNKNKGLNEGRLKAIVEQIKKVGRVSK